LIVLNNYSNISASLPEVRVAYKMSDVIVVLPGIAGSILQKDGKDIWALSGQALSTYLKSFGGSLEQLTLSAIDDPALDSLGDGITATSLMPDTHIIPGFWKIDGYGELTRMLKDRFEVQEHANYFEFPYDWRRDNRASAAKLDKLVNQSLHDWRIATQNPLAKVIFIAHSMGGLVARYFIEVLGGWNNCRALITFGTPYRGSVKALNYIFNGYSVGWTDISALFRSCTSVYQLLPTYPVIKDSNGNVRRIQDLGSSAEFDAGRASQAKSFHDTIACELAKNSKSDSYRQQYRILPVVGVEQPTLASATVIKDRVLASEELAEGVDPQLAHGDGTVPLASAIPQELSEEFRMPFFAEMHGSLQNNPFVLAELTQWLRQSQVKNLDKLKGINDEPEPRDANRPYISLRMDDMYPADVPIAIDAITNTNDILTNVFASVYSVNNTAVPVRQELHLDPISDSWTTTLTGLVEGCYRIKISCRSERAAQQPAAVSDVFMVSGS
jgi:hypothetical protein